MPEDNNIEDIDKQEEESRFRKVLKKTYVLITVFLLLILFLVNTAPGYHLISVLSGKIVSSTLEEDYTFNLKYGGKVVFNKKVYENLRQIYQENQKHEFKACLQGEKKNKDYYVDGIYIPKIYSQDVFSVSSQICNSSTIISLHSHPPLRCIFSEQDIKSYNNFKQINPRAMLGLMCDEERLTFFGYEQ
jgi:proteasome lid subunit RPN8/RPN11